MRKLILTLIVLLALIGAAAVYLVATTPKSADPIRFPLNASHRQLLGRVPASAESFALVESAALLHGKLLANPVTQASVLQWTSEHELPRPWMLGGADLVVWKSDKTTSYALQLDGFRALLVRAWLLVSSNAAARWDGSMLIMHDATTTPVAASADLDSLLRLAAGLPEGDVFVVQRESGRGAFPPIGRPAVTSVRVTPAEIVLVSRAATTDIAEQTEIRPSFPRGAMLAAAFAAPPRILGDLDRLLGTRIDELLGEGGGEHRTARKARADFRLLGDVGRCRARKASSSCRPPNARASRRKTSSASPLWWARCATPATASWSRSTAAAWACI
jgi:hypothetical protein